MTEIKDSQTSVNDPRTQASSDTELTQPRSGFDLEDTRRSLIAMRTKLGADTPAGHRCSNIIEQLQNMRDAEGDQREPTRIFREEPLTVVYRHWICDANECNGEMKSTGVGFMSNPPQYPHQCEKCHRVESASTRYPRVAYLPIEEIDMMAETFRD